MTENRGVLYSYLWKMDADYGRITSVWEFVCFESSPIASFIAADESPNNKSRG